MPDEYFLFGTASTLLDVNQSLNGVLGNDTDPDSSHDDLMAILVSGAAHGAITLNGNGTFTYTLVDTSFAGDDTFTYKVSDDVHESGDVTVTIHIAQVRLRVVAGGPSVAGQTTSTLDGKRNNLLVELENACGRTMAVSWTIPGSAVDNYDLATNTVTYVTSELMNESIDWYWTIENSTQTVSVDVTVEGQTATLTRNYSVARPCASVTVGTTSVYRQHSDPGAFIDFSGYMAVGFGDAMGTEGIIMTGDNGDPGQFAWVQIINSYSLSAVWDGDAPEGIRLVTGANILDVEPGEPITEAPVFKDAPTIPILAGMHHVETNQQFSTYVLFKPDGGIYVPMEKVNWYWSFSGTRGADNVFLFDFVPNWSDSPAPENISAYPTPWSAKAEDQLYPDVNTTIYTP